MLKLFSTNIKIIKMINCIH